MISNYSVRFKEWANQYGEIFSLKMGPSTAIVITSPRLIKQLVDRKSSIYSHRPKLYIGNGIITGGDHILTMQYSERWRRCRRLIHQYFMDDMVSKKHTKVVDAEAVQMLRDFVISPEDHMMHPKRFSNSVVSSLGEEDSAQLSCTAISDDRAVYGVRTPSANSVNMKKLYDLIKIWAEIMEPGNTPPMDIFKFLRHVPESLLGRWRSRAEHVRDEMLRLYGHWFHHVEKRRENFGTTDCFLDGVLDQEEKLGFNRHLLYFLCGTLYEGGSDTSACVILAFIHAMTKWPQVQLEAQAEIDRIVGEERSPTWEDYSKLPYVIACVKEAQRWRPVVPLAFPHSLAEDDWIEGMYLPKGSDVFINTFGMHHDERRFPEPDVFDPSHFKGYTALASQLASGDYESRDHYGYGSGRRICPGMHLAERNLFLAIAKLLWAFRIESGADVNGNRIDPDISNETAYGAGTLVCAEPYSCKVTPRSLARQETILREFELAQTDVFSKYDVPREN